MSPRRPGRPCAWPRCPVVVTAGRFCAIHASLYERQRGSAASRGYGAEHRAWRAQVLAREPYCVDPDGRHPGRVELATVADHVRPVRDGGDWSLDNGRGLCLPCHNAISARQGARLRGGA